MKPSIASKLAQLSARLEELNALLSSEDVTKDLEKKLPGDMGKQVGDVLQNKDGSKGLEKGVGDLLGGGSKKKKDSTTKGQ